MTLKRKIIKIIFFLLSLLLIIMYEVGCQRGIDISGGASDTEVSATIKGEVKDVYGNTISDGKVFLKPRDYTPLKKSVNSKIASKNGGFSSIDINGKFSLDSINKGLYLLEVLAGESLGITEEISIDSNYDIYKTLTVKPLGSINGYVDFSFTSSTLKSNTHVEVFGTDHLIWVDTSTGYFNIPVPEGKHKIRISTDTESFDDIIIDNINVLSKQSRFIGTIRLNYKFIDPACWTYSCDSAIVRELLDSNGHQDIEVESVTLKAYDRITALNLEGISLRKNLDLIGKLNALEVLNLNSTGISDSCRFLCGLWNLKALRLKGNNINGLSRCLEGLVNLKILDVSDNLLINLPERVMFLYLEKVDLSGNMLCNLPDAMSRWATIMDGDWKETQKCSMPYYNK